MWIVEGRRGTAFHGVSGINVDEAHLRKLALAFFKSMGMATAIWPTDYNLRAFRRADAEVRSGSIRDTLSYA
jgi:hypothetical protein